MDTAKIIEIAVLVLFSIVGFLASRTLVGIDKNQRDLTEKLAKMETRFDTHIETIPREFVTKIECRLSKEECVGKGWVAAVQRLEDSFNHKFDELNKTMHDFTLAVMAIIKD